MTLEKKKIILEKLNQYLDMQEGKQKKLNENLSRLERKRRIRKLIIAGQLFERVGILENYDEELMLGILQSSKFIKINDEVYLTYKSIGGKLLDMENEKDE